MKAKHFNMLKAMVQSSPRFAERMEYSAAGLSDKRYRWDCLWSIDSKWKNEWFSEVYSYLNDNHIDTALKHITGTR